MFKIKRADGYPFETIAYDTRELDCLSGDDRLQFLIYHKKKWDWVYAKDFMPVDVPITMSVYINGRYFCETNNEVEVCESTGEEKIIDPKGREYYDFKNFKFIKVNGTVIWERYNFFVK